MVVAVDEKISYFQLMVGEYSFEISSDKIPKCLIKSKCLWALRKFEKVITRKRTAFFGCLFFYSVKKR